MELNRKNLTRILLITCSSILFFVLLMNITPVFNFFKTVFIVLEPLILGASIAFIVNIPMSFIERIIFPDKLTSKQKWLKIIKRPISLFLGYIFIALIFAIFMMLIIPELYKTILAFIQLLPTYIQTASDWFTNHNIGTELLDKINWNSISIKLAEYLQQTGTHIIDKTVGFTAGLFSAVFNFILGFVFSVYLLSSKEKLAQQFNTFFSVSKYKPHYDKFVKLVRLSNETFTKFIVGQFAEAIILGVLCFIGMKIFNMPYALMISSLISITALIPVFGAFIGAGTGAFMILLIDPIKALWFILFIIILQQLETNIIYPKVVGKSVGLAGIWVLVAVTIGGRLFGAVGLLISVPIFSVLYCLIRDNVYSKLHKNSKQPAVGTGKKQ